MEFLGTMVGKLPAYVSIKDCGIVALESSLVELNACQSVLTWEVARVLHSFASTLELVFLHHYRGIWILFLFF